MFTRFTNQKTCESAPPKYINEWHQPILFRDYIRETSNDTSVTSTSFQRLGRRLRLAMLDHLGVSVKVFRYTGEVKKPRLLASNSSIRIPSNMCKKNSWASCCRNCVKYEIHSNKRDCTNAHVQILVVLLSKASKELSVHSMLDQILGYGS